MNVGILNENFKIPYVTMRFICIHSTILCKQGTYLLKLLGVIAIIVTGFIRISDGLLGDNYQITNEAFFLSKINGYC